MKKFPLLYFIFILVMLLLPGVLLAIELQVPIGNIKEVKDLGDYIQKFYVFFVTSAGVLSAVMIVLGGYRWVVASGNAQKISEAKETIVSAVLGLVLALCSYVLLNTINPNITSLKPLVIPIVSPMAVEGAAKRLCDWDQEINKETGKPVECGKTIYVNPTETDEKCLGVMHEDDKHYCEVVEIGGQKMGSQKSEVAILNHSTQQTVFKVDNGPGLVPNDYKSCGIVFYNRYELIYQVGNSCYEPPEGRERCYLEGDSGNFVTSPDVYECEGINDSNTYTVWINGQNFQFSGTVIKAGCGTLSNMKCQD